MKSRHRIFVAHEQVTGGVLSFTGEDLHYLRKVLRLREGDHVRATDGRGSEFQVRLENADGGLRGEVVERSEPRRESPLRITLAQAVPRRELMDLVVQKAVELGVSAIRPVLTARTVVSLDDRRSRQRMERWRKIAGAALAQSGRTVMPEMGEPARWEDFLGEHRSGGLKILLREDEQRGLADLLGEVRAPDGVLLAVGPEGGWERRETDAAHRAGFESVSLGPRILRTETAGLAVISTLQYLYGDLGGYNIPSAGEERRERREG